MASYVQLINLYEPKQSMYIIVRERSLALRAPAFSNLQISCHTFMTKDMETLGNNCVFHSIIAHRAREFLLFKINITIVLKNINK